MASEMKMITHSDEAKIDKYNIIRIEKGNSDEFKLVYRDEAKQIKIETSTECEKNGILRHKIFNEFQQELGFDTMNDLHEAYQEFYETWKHGDVVMNVTAWNISEEAYPVSNNILFSIGNISGYNVDEFIKTIQSKTGIDSTEVNFILFDVRLTVYYLNTYTTYYLYIDCIFHVQGYGYTNRMEKLFMWN